MRDCCKEKVNRERPIRLSEDMSVSLCRICGAKHFEMEVEPGKLWAEGTAA